MRLIQILQFAALLAILPALTVAKNPRSEEVQKVPLIGDPLAKRAPDFAAWTITFDYPAGSQKKAKTSTAMPGQITSIVVTKSKDTYCEQIHYEDQSQREIWIVKDLLVQPDGSGRLCLYPIGSMNAGGGGESGPDEIVNADGILVFNKTDFPDLQWLSKENFIGLKKTKAGANLVFEGITSTCFAATGVTGSSVTVLVDSQSRLPYEISCKEWTMHFEFGPAPENRLALPPAVQALLDQRNQQMQESLKRNPSI